MNVKRGLVVAVTLASVAALVMSGLRFLRQAKIAEAWQSEQTKFFLLKRRIGAPAAEEDVRARTYVTHWEAKGTFVRERVENCPSCHMGVLAPELAGEDVPRELRAHPSPKLLEKHPPETFGCTSCHGGEGTWAEPHPRVVRRETPKGKEWVLEADENDTSPGEPLLRLATRTDELPTSAAAAIPAELRDAFFETIPEVEAGCLKCHMTDAELDGASHLAEGRALFRDLGCGACHAVARMPRAPKPGAPLTDIASRLKPAYVLAYLKDPRALNAAARMPLAWPRGTDSAARDAEALAIAAFLFERSAIRGKAGKAPNVARAANVPGASAEDGKLLFDAYGCAGCHIEQASRARAPSLAAAGDAWTEDWLAAWLFDPKSLWPDATMPSLRLDKREAASIAKYLGARHADAPLPEDPAVAIGAKHAERITCPSGGAEMTRAQCGELLVMRYACLACHDLEGVGGDRGGRSPPVEGGAGGSCPPLNLGEGGAGGAWAPEPRGPALDGYAVRARLAKDATLRKLESPREGDPLARMPDYALSAREIRALMVFLAGLGDAVPRPDFDAAASPAHRAIADGAALAKDLGCRACHEMDGAPPRIKGAPALTHEGARARPEWLFAFLDRPGENGVRPELHPEWVYGELVPPSKLALRMPSFALATEDATAIVRMFAARDGATFPFAPPRVKKLAPEERIAAVTSLNAQCMRCHYLGELPRERAKTEALAPNLALPHARLRLPWVKSFLPEHARGADAAVADLLFLLRDTTKLPRAGDEARAPILGLAE